MSQWITRGSLTGGILSLCVSRVEKTNVYHLSFVYRCTNSYRRPVTTPGARHNLHNNKIFLVCCKKVRGKKISTYIFTIEHETIHSFTALSCLYRVDMKTHKLLLREQFKSKFTRTTNSRAEINT